MAPGRNHLLSIKALHEMFTNYIRLDGSQVYLSENMQVITLHFIFSNKNLTEISNWKLSP